MAAYPMEERWLRVLLGVVEAARAVLVRDPHHNIGPKSEVGILLEALRAGCWISIDAPLQDEMQETLQDNDEKQQVRALLCVLDDVWWRKLFCWAGDVTKLLGLLRRLCWKILEGGDAAWPSTTLDVDADRCDFII